jgi:hypothetical protein
MPFSSSGMFFSLCNCRVHASHVFCPTVGPMFCHSPLSFHHISFNIYTLVHLLEALVQLRLIESFHSHAIYLSLFCMGASSTVINSKHESCCLCDLRLGFTSESVTQFTFHFILFIYLRFIVFFHSCSPAHHSTSSKLNMFPLPHMYPYIYMEDNSSSFFVSPCLYTHSLTTICT